MAILIVAAFFRWFKNFKNMKLILWILLVVVIVIIIYFLGPKPAKPNLNAIVKSNDAVDLIHLEKEIISAEKSVPNLKLDNEARIVWANDSLKSKTEFSVVYLHGFSASCGEGYPVNMEFAKRYGCNMYLARLHAHGLESENNLLDLTPENYLESAKEAVNIGRQLGEKVILMSTSTGGTLSLAIASENPWIHALILYSPNIDVVDQSANILLKPWGLKIAQLIKGKFNKYDDPPEVQKYWQSKYRLEGVQAMKGLVNATMNKETFQMINQPLFLGYYYEDENNQDPTVMVSRMLEMFEQISTPDAEKWNVPFLNTKVHPIPSGILSKDVESVKTKTFEFAEKVLTMRPVLSTKL